MFWRSFQNLSIRYKLIVGFALVTILLVAFGANLITNLNAVNGSFEKIDEEYKNFIGYHELEEIRDQRSDSIKAYILTGNQSWEGLYTDAAIESDRKVAEIIELQEDPEEAAQFAKFAAIDNKLRATELSILTKVRVGDTVAAGELIDGEYPAYHRASHHILDELVRQENEEIGIYIENIQSLLTSVKKELLVWFAGSIAVVVAISLLLSSHISRPLRKLVDAAQRISQGSLNTRVQISSKDEIGRVGVAFDAMASKLQGSIDNLEQQVGERTQELSKANHHLEQQITQREAAELRLRALATNLETSNRELEYFASVASHDLQEPLRKVLAFGDLLKSGFSEALAAQGQDYLHRMLNATERMQTLIDDILTLSRVTTKGEPFVPVDLGAVANAVVNDLEVTIGQAGGVVEVSDLPIIDADPTQMRQLFQNLISNSLKFRKATESPAVSVRSQFVYPEGNNGGRNAFPKEMVCLEVKDNGIGFDEKHVGRIFNVFQRLHGRSEYAGTGIGLAVCRKIVARHGGDITAKSKPGQGATFIVTLPAIQRQGR